METTKGTEKLSVAVVPVDKACLLASLKLINETGLLL